MLTQLALAHARRDSAAFAERCLLDEVTAQPVQLVGMHRKEHRHWASSDRTVTWAPSEHGKSSNLHGAFLPSGASVRPVRDQLIAAARRREVDAIVCFKLDRWGRSTADLVSSLTELDSCGCSFVSVTDAIDMTTPSGRALAGMLAVFAGFERDLIRERVQAGLEAAKARGVQLGRPTTARDKVGEVRALRAEGLSQRAIASRLGIGSGSVARMLSE